MRQAQLLAKTQEAAQVGLDLAQTQQKYLNLQQERTEMAAQLDKAKTDVSELSQRCTNAAAKHRQEEEQ